MLIFLTLSCGRNVTAPKYHTWNSLNEKEYGEPLSPVPVEIPPQGFFPWAGIVSHHVLAHEYLDAWFAQLSKIRKPKRFYILSPDHYGLSLEPYSLTNGSWESGFGFVESDSKKVRKLAEMLEVDMDPGLFASEHGVSTLMPYIKKYFPKARVIAIAYESEAPVNIPISGRLADVLEKEFDAGGKRENFLLVSSDFSHRGDLEETQRRDSYSEQYLRGNESAAWNMVSCDNRQGIYILDRLGKNALRPCIFYHTNSWEISKQGEDNITSYFFAFFADP